MSDKRLKKSRKDRVICGVCGGIAEYFKVDPTLVRLAFALLCISAFTGVILYIIAAIIMPEDFD